MRFIWGYIFPVKPSACVHAYDPTCVVSHYRICLVRLSFTSFDVHRQLAAGAPWQGATAMLRDPAVALFGLAGFGVIMGKHTDKITRSRKKTLPAVLGMNRALKACQLTLLAPHVLLLWTFWRERIVGGMTPTVPWGAALAFLTLFREFPAAMRTMSMGPIRNDKPNLPRKTIIKGTLLNADVDRAWPLWFVAFMGWHALTFAYLMVIGSGVEWMGRALLTRFGPF